MNDYESRFDHEHDTNAYEEEEREYSDDDLKNFRDGISSPFEKSQFILDAQERVRQWNENTLNHEDILTMNLRKMGLIK